MVVNYLKNVTKSMTYLTAKVVKDDLTPNAGEFLNSNKDFIASTYAILKNPKIAFRRSVAVMQQSKTYKALDYGIKNTFEDLRTGNWYNTKRIERDEARLAGMDANDWNDLSEFGVDDNWEDILNGKSKPKDKSSVKITAGDAMVSSTIEKTSAANALTTSEAVMRSTEASVKSARYNMSTLYMQNEKLIGGLHKDLSVLNGAVDSIQKMLSASIQNIDTNLSNFFTESSKLNTERNKMLA